MADGDNNAPPQDGAGKPPEPLHESTLGARFVGVPGVLAIGLYLVLFSVSIFYVMIEVWPPTTAPTQSSAQGQTTAPPTTPAGPATSPSGGPAAPGPGTTAPPAGSPASGTPPGTTPASTGGPSTPGVTAGTTLTPASSSTQTQTASTQPGELSKWTVDFFWCTGGCPITNNTALFLIAILSGALGSLLHALRSLYWYIGNRKLVWSWSYMFILLPFCGATLSLIFYIVIRGGLLPQSNLSSGNPFGFAAIGATVGLFSEQAILKLKQVAETLFTSPQKGKDSVGAPLKLTSITPPAGSSAGGTPVTITGTNFASGAKLNIGAVAATDIVVASPTSITAKTPAHAAGPVDVEVVNTDNQKDVLKGAFTYT